MFSDVQTEIDKQTDETNLELFFYYIWVNLFKRAIIIPPPPRKFCLWMVYTVFTMSVHPFVPAVTFCFLNILKCSGISSNLANVFISSNKNLRVRNQLIGYCFPL